MDKQARIAFIIAQSAVLNAEIEMRKAANLERQEQGKALAYGEKEFYDLIYGEFYCLLHNEVISYLRD